MGAKMTISLVLLLLALFCFVLHAIAVPSKINLQSVGLALWVLSMMSVGR
jgi:hypothetical protein